MRGQQAARRFKTAMIEVMRRGASFVLYCSRFRRRGGCRLSFLPRHWMGVGSPRKHMPRKKIPADLRSLARGHTEQCIKVLAGMLSQEAVPAAARVSAAALLLDRGWGRAPQAIIGANGEGDIKVTIRHILEHIDETPMTIAGEVVRDIDADATVEDQVDQS